MASLPFGCGAPSSPPFILSLQVAPGKRALDCAAEVRAIRMGAPFRRERPVHLIYALLLLCGFLAMPVAAADLYKSIMPNGKVVYGEKPEPGARQVEKLPAPPPKTGTTLVTPAEKKAVDTSVKQRVAGDEEWRRQLDSAYAQLKKAEEAREAGKEPLPGERLGTVGGGSRLTDYYWARQKKLEAAVESARKHVEE